MLQLFSVDLLYAENIYQKNIFRVNLGYFNTFFQVFDAVTHIHLPGEENKHLNIPLAAGILSLYTMCGAACHCCFPPLSAVKLIYKREGPVGCHQPISISVMAAWQYPAVPDVPPRADGALVSSAVLLQCSLRWKHICATQSHMVTCMLSHTHTHTKSPSEIHHCFPQFCHGMR